MKTPNYPIESLSRDSDDDLFFPKKRLEITRNTKRDNLPDYSDSSGSVNPNDSLSLSDRLSAFQNRKSDGLSDTLRNKTVGKHAQVAAVSNRNRSGEASIFNDSGSVPDITLVSRSKGSQSDRPDSSNSLNKSSLLNSSSLSKSAGLSNKSGLADKLSSKESASGSPPNSGGKGKKGKSKKRIILKRTLLATLIIFGLGCIVVGSFVFSAVKETPKYDPSKLDNLAYASFIYDKNGDQIAQIDSTENRLPFNYEDIPDLFIKTLLAVEDKSFFEHPGFNLTRIIKGAYNTILNPNKPEGGSTLTTQLAKNTFIDNDDRTSRGIEGIKRKIQEIVLATEIEHNYSKQEILTAYMTQTYLGHGAFGVRSAAQVYFGKEPMDLTIPEIALICGLPQAPNSYDPYLSPEKAKNRRAIVLSVMRDEGLITQEEYEQYKEEPFTFVDAVNDGTAEIKTGQGAPKRFPYFIDYVIKSLLDENQYNLTEQQVYRGGLKIYTTVDPEIQEEVEKVLQDSANFPANAKTDGKPVQGAIVVLENSTGNVAAIGGGREYPEGHSLVLNRASSSYRQPGSCAKPIIAYAPALEKGGFFAGTVLDDSPLKIGSWTPKNSNNSYSGLITMRYAITRSINIYAIKLYQEAGTDYCFNFAKDKLGLTMPEASSSNLSNALGAFEATPLEIARAYSAFPNQGILNETNCVTKITDSSGKVILEKPQGNSTRAMKESTAYIMCDLMRSVVKDAGGTGGRAAIGNWYICGKTGTTNSDYYSGGPDAWFTGFNSYYTASVWMGFDQSDKDHHLDGQYGGDKPATMWNKVMRVALKDKPVQSLEIFPRPSNVIPVQFDIMSGMSPGPLTPSDLVSTEISSTEGAPTQPSNVWIEMSVDRLAPNYLAPSGYPLALTTTRVFLNLPNRGWWADKELPYKPPTEYSKGFLGNWNQFNHQDD